MVLSVFRGSLLQDTPGLLANMKHTLNPWMYLRRCRLYGNQPLHHTRSRGELRSKRGLLRIRNRATNCSFFWRPEHWGTFRTPRHSGITLGTTQRSRHPDPGNYKNTDGQPKTERGQEELRWRSNHDGDVKSRTKKRTQAPGLLLAVYKIWRHSTRPFWPLSIRSATMTKANVHVCACGSEWLSIRRKQRHNKDWRLS